LGWGHNWLDICDIVWECSGNQKGRELSIQRSRRQRDPHEVLWAVSVETRPGDLPTDGHVGGRKSEKRRLMFGKPRRQEWEDEE